MYKRQRGNKLKIKDGDFMKKFMALLLVAGMTLSLTACGDVYKRQGQVSRWHFKKSLPEGTSKKWLMGKQEKL